MSICNLISSSTIPKVNLRMSLISCLLFLYLAQCKQDSIGEGGHIQPQFRKIAIAL